jgi:hypothetical protein
MPPQLSEAIKELIAKSRIVSFTAWDKNHSVDVIARFQAADDERRYLTDEDLQFIEVNSPETSSLIPVVRDLRDHVTDIVDAARAKVLATFPAITQPGGGLYPPDRADACWRDFWHFLRCITYGIAGCNIEYTSAAGLDAMQLLYQELKVPLDAMVVGLEAIRTASLARIQPHQPEQLAPYFDRLIDQLKTFR